MSHCVCLELTGKDFAACPQEFDETTR